MKWTDKTIETRSGPQRAITPEIISASRSTDIPAFYADWFMNRFRAGYVKWVNPFNRQAQYVSFENARVFVFWSKNPRPLIASLPEIDQRKISYYFHFTLNDYEKEKLEPGVLPLATRIKTFIDLSTQLGRDRVIWRFDPLLLTDELDVKKLLSKIERVGNEVAPHTAKLVFSFADISVYRKVQSNLKRCRINYREIAKESMGELAQGIADLCKGWGISASTCGELADLSAFGVEHNKCIDDELILKMAPNDKAIRHLFGLDLVQNDLFSISANRSPKKIKDPGQRAECGCVFSKDIGQYNTCPHLCLYCYANSSENAVRKNREKVSKDSESITGE